MLHPGLCCAPAKQAHVPIVQNFDLRPQRYTSDTDDEIEPVCENGTNRVGTTSLAFFAEVCVTTC